MRQRSVLDSQIKDFLSKLSERQIAILLLNIRSDPQAYPLAAAQTETIREFAQQELQRRRFIPSR